MKSNNTEIILYRPNILVDPTFADISLWDGNANNEWTFTGNEAVYTSLGFNDMLTQTVLIKGVTYRCKLTVSGLTAGSFLVTLGTNTEGLSANGTYEFNVLADTTDETLYPAEIYSIFPILVNTGASISLASVIEYPTDWSL